MWAFFKIPDGIQDGRQTLWSIKYESPSANRFWLIMGSVDIFFWSWIQWKYFWKDIMRSTIYHGDISFTKHLGFTHQWKSS